MAQMNLSTKRNKLMDLENRLVVDEGRGREWDVLGTWG